ncbi:alpha-beta hydrolase superfamily lysophospholipase [Lysobacter sp. OAE881]|uniref:alpha/beta hydrolase family protein n=1 Tax=Lysobacter sp. OAE881 TaxID=2663813 RepID=UPI00178955F9
MSTAQNHLANSTAARPDQRMARKFRFNDTDMDLFFMSAVSLGPTGGLDVGQADYIASQIVDGDADSWVDAFAAYGEHQDAQADAWSQRGWRRAAGEARMKAFASFRSAWQFAQAGGARFRDLYARHRAAFAKACDELRLPTSLFDVPFDGKTLPGLFVRNANPDAPVVLVIGGADTCREDLFLSLGRGIWDRGYSVAMVDLPGQGITPADGMRWEIEPERPIAAVVDTLVERFGAQPGRIALLGLSFGGYFVTRAAQFDGRFATVIASTPFPRPIELLERSVHAHAGSDARITPSSAALRSRMMMAWKAGATSADDMLERWRDAKADASRVTVPFLSVIGAGDSAIFNRQAFDWHEQIASTRKACVVLDAATGADSHCQVNARVRLVQEACGWMDDIFETTPLSGA